MISFEIEDSEQQQKIIKLRRRCYLTFPDDIEILVNDQVVAIFTATAGGNVEGAELIIKHERLNSMSITVTDIDDNVFGKDMRSGGHIDD